MCPLCPLFRGYLPIYVAEACGEVSVVVSVIVILSDIGADGWLRSKTLRMAARQYQGAREPFDLESVSRDKRSGVPVPTMRPISPLARQLVRTYKAGYARVRNDGGRQRVRL